MANLFGAAKTIPGKKPAAKADKKTSVNINGLKTLAEIDALIKALGGIKQAVEADVKNDAFAKFVENGRKDHKRPENIRGVDGIASASIEFRKRSTTSVLSDEEVALFNKEGIPVEQVVTVQKLFGVNPKYATDDTLLEKVSGAIEHIVPEDFFVVQEEVSKTVVTDTTMEEAFKNDASLAILKAISVISIKPKLEETNLNTIIDDLKSMLIPTAE